MARLPRLVVPGLAHHMTQRDNGRQATFFEEGDYALYLDLFAEAAARANVEVWAYCLITGRWMIKLSQYLKGNG
ncbi:hypothetical protein [Sphingomonas sp. ERG5]|uniref:hypothetical protein n=1 Tax=Sphingomonas sp. ERG5 TaxID=1381597 RepID=UPI00126A1838|nr:hypothetical protein [Sphingomonas sp. ERG5]